MAYFEERSVECERCGTHEKGVLTDLFSESSDIPPSKKDARSYCFECYIELVDCVKTVSVYEVSSTEKCSEHLIVGSTGMDHAEEIESRILDTPLSDRVVSFSHSDLKPIYAGSKNSELFPDYYCRQLARGPNSENWNIYSSAVEDENGVSVMDHQTHVTEKTRDKMKSELFDRILTSESYEDVEVRDDAHQLVSDTYPYLYGYGLASGLGTELWNYLTEEEPEILSGDSKMAVENQIKGRSFEEFFRELCENADVECYRSRHAFRSEFPEEYAKVVDEFGRDFKGMPDFFVVGDSNQMGLENWSRGDVEQQSSSEKKRWKPETGSAFVEVKYNSSDLSPEQREVTEFLSAMGFEVYVLRGTPEEFEFEEI